MIGSNHPLEKNFHEWEKEKRDEALARMKTEADICKLFTPEVNKWIHSLITQKADIFEDDILWEVMPFELTALILYRALEGYNKKYFPPIHIYEKMCEYVNVTPKRYYFKDYVPDRLTQCECALLHCLIDRYTKEKSNDKN